MAQLCQLVGTMFELVHCDPAQTRKDKRDGERQREREEEKVAVS